jgi:hypothetical protein
MIFKISARRSARPGEVIASHNWEWPTTNGDDCRQGHIRYQRVDALRV